MYLFDVVRKLNDEIALFLNKGMPGPVQPKLVGVTDGYTVHICFMDVVIWHSEEWGFEREQTNPHPDDIEYEMTRLENYLKDRVMDHLLYLYNIQW